MNHGRPRGTRAAFWWGPQDLERVESYWPLIYKMEEWYRAYRTSYAGFDATGVQKGFDELVFAQRGSLMEAMNLQGRKMSMVIALELVMGRGLPQLATKISNMWLQLA